jgi:hypothetical protein
MPPSRGGLTRPPARRRRCVSGTSRGPGSSDLRGWEHRPVVRVLGGRGARSSQRCSCGSGPPGAPLAGHRLRPRGRGRRSGPPMGGRGGRPILGTSRRRWRGGRRRRRLCVCVRLGRRGGRGGVLLCACRAGLGSRGSVACLGWSCRIRCMDGAACCSSWLALATLAQLALAGRAAFAVDDGAVATDAACGSLLARNPLERVRGAAAHGYRHLRARSSSGVAGRCSPLRTAATPAPA